VLSLVALVFLFGIVGFLSGKINVQNYAPFAPKGWKTVFPAIAYGTYAYMGALTLATSGSEVKNQADLPKSLVWASVTVIIVYSFAMTAMFGLVPSDQLSVSESPFVSAAHVAFGKAAASIINAGAFLAAATCLLAGTMYSAPRLLYSIGHKKIIPHFFSKLSEEKKVPVNAIIFVWTASILLIIVGIGNPDLMYVYLSLLLVFCWAVTWLISIVSSVVYRIKYTDEINKLEWRQPFYPLFPVLGFAGIGIIFYGAFKGAMVSLLSGIIFIGLLITYYYISKKSENKRV